MARARVWIRGLVCSTALAASQAWALEVRYAAVDMADVVPGVDRWRYDYTLIGSLAEFEGVSLLFAPDTSRALALVSAPDPNTLATFIEQPSAALPAVGLLALTAVRSFIDQALTFSVAFDRLGPALPGAQSYERFDADFNLVAGPASTVPATVVPEPPSSALMVVAVLALGLALRLRRRPRAFV